MRPFFEIGFSATGVIAVIGPKGALTATFWSIGGFDCKSVRP